MICAFCVSFTEEIIPIRLQKSNKQQYQRQMTVIYATSAKMMQTVVTSRKLTLISTSGKSVGAASKPGKYWTVYRKDPP